MDPTSTDARTSTRTDHASVAGIALAAALSVAVAEGAWDPWSAVVGIMLLVLLIAFVDRTALRGAPEAAAFSLVYGLCVALIAGVFVELLWRLIASIVNDNVLADWDFIEITLLASGSDKQVFDLVELTLIAVWLIAAGVQYRRLLPRSA